MNSRIGLLSSPSVLPLKTFLLGCLLSALSIFAWAQGSANSQLPTENRAWQQLSATDRQALSPLAERWGELTDTQRRKWRAIAQNFDQFSTTEQAVMHERMAEWAALSPTLRNQARLNFNTVQSLPKDEKKTKWDAYQALPEAQKRELSAGVLSTSKTTAPSAQPANAHRLVQPAVRTLPAAALPARPPIDQKTLLPLPIPAGAASAPQIPAKAAPNAPTREVSSK